MYMILIADNITENPVDLLVRRIFNFALEYIFFYYRVKLTFNRFLGPKIPSRQHLLRL